MREQSLYIRLGALLILSASSFFLWWADKENTPSPYLEVTFLDVGQGDAILIETPDGVQALIDGGPDSTVLRELARELPWGDRTLNVIVGTHPDKDHIGGLIDVLARYAVNQILTTENRGETIAAGTFYDALIKETNHVVLARAGQVYTLGASTTLTVYSPASNPALLESNTASIVAKLTYGETDFLLTGDAPQSIEDYLSVAYGAQLQSEVLKLGHHGSKTSTSELFLQTVAPRYAVVSAGRDNNYGHPHEEVVSRVHAMGVEIRHTADDGAVHFFSDGQRVWTE